MRSLRLLAAVGLAGALFAAAFAFAAPPALQAQPRPPRNVSQCDGTITGTLSTNQIQICDPLTVTVEVAPVCPICPNGVNVVYVQVDVAFQADWMVQESLASFDRLRASVRNSRGNQAPTRIGVVHYNRNQVRKTLQMTDSIDAARGPLSQPQNGHDPFGNVIGAARAALELMRDARRSAADLQEGDHPCEFVVFFASSKSIYTEQGRDMIQAAQMIKNDGIKLFVGCPETVADYCVFTREMPEQGQYYTQANDHGKLSRMVEQHMASLDDDAVTVRDLYLTQFLPPGLAYVDGSANVPPKAVNRTQDDRIRIDWEWKRIRSTLAQTITYGAKPLAEGSGVIEGAARLVDMNNKDRDLPMASQAITVTGMCIPPPSETPTDVPTPTEIPTDTPTPTPTRTPTPTATRTPTPTATPTPEPQPIYLPVMINERCTIQWVYSDVVLVVDMSTSMNRGTEGGRTKLEATLDAAKAFLTMMDLSPDADGRSDRIAVVGFNAIAWIELPLSGDLAALHGAIDHLPSGQGQFTRLDLGFETGLEALRPALGQPNTTPVMVFLTDGLPNRVPVDPVDGTMETTVRKAAQKVKDAGAKIYTIGIGLPEDINSALMSQCATSSANYFYTPDPEALSGIYTQIAYSFGCPKGRHEWGQPWP